MVWSRLITFWKQVFDPHYFIHTLIKNHNASLFPQLTTENGYFRVENFSSSIENKGNYVSLLRELRHRLSVLGFGSSFAELMFELVALFPLHWNCISCCRTDAAPIFYSRIFIGSTSRILWAVLLPECVFAFGLNLAVYELSNSSKDFLWFWMGCWERVGERDCGYGFRICLKIAF